MPLLFRQAGALAASSERQPLSLSLISWTGEGRDRSIPTGDRHSAVPPGFDRNRMSEGRTQTVPLLWSDCSGCTPVHYCHCITGPAWGALRSPRAARPSLIRLRVVVDSKRRLSSTGAKGQLGAPCNRYLRVSCNAGWRSDQPGDQSRARQVQGGGRGCHPATAWIPQ